MTFEPYDPEAPPIADDELELLRELAKGCRVLETGTQHGYTTLAMAQVATQVHTVDWHYWGKQLPGDTLPTFWRNVWDADLRGKIVIHVGESRRVLPYLASESFDLIFIDGDHTEAGCAFDLGEARRLCGLGATIAVHDFGGPDWPGVKKACYDFAPEDAWEVTGSLAVLRSMEIWNG